MAGKRDLRLALRPAETPLGHLLAAADKARDLNRIARLGLVYARGIYAPNIKEPFYIANRRDALVDGVRAYDRKHGARPAARRAA